MDKICKYDSYDNIPAKVFFEIRETGNFQLMRAKNATGNEKLAPLFMQIYDDYFLKSNNRDAKRYLELINTTAAIQYKIDAIKSILNFHWNLTPSLWSDPLIIEYRNQQIMAINEYLDMPINLDAADFDTEIETALNVSLGIMQNDLTEANMEIESLRSSSSKTVFEFYDSMASINKVNAPYSINPKCLLGEYVAAEKLAINEINRIKTKAA